MPYRNIVILLACISLCLSAALAQEVAPAAGTQPVSQETLNKLLDRLAADEQKIDDLERRLQGASPLQQTTKEVSPATASPATEAGISSPPSPPTATATQPATTSPGAVPAATAPPPASDETASAELGSGNSSGHQHMGLGVGQLLRINGYFDFNFGAGQDSNPLIFPLGATPHTTFQAGEFDLMTHSQLSDSLSFMSEIVLGADATNEIGPDIERYILTYHLNKYFEVSGGRFHTAIGYYNTAFHHGTWFQTATGRPFMYFFEDSGGLLPVHTVGVTTTGLVPGTEKIGLHWIAEIGNGRPSNENDPGAVQNFYSDRNHKAYNLAAYIPPEGMPALQIGASLYKDRLYPTGLPAANQTISSFYAVYITPTWEFMNEGVLLTNQMQPGRTYNTPLAYTQLSRRFHLLRPYVRYQFVNSPTGDPVNIYTGLYTGPSVGLRWDAAEFLAFKLQGNLLDQSNDKVSTGLDAQISFTF